MLIESRSSENDFSVIVNSFVKLIIMSDSIVGNCILYLFVSLLLGFCAYELKKKLHVPVSPILLVFGIIIRDLANSMGAIGTAFQQVDSIDPHLILYGMMPALIFEVGIATD